MLTVLSSVFVGTAFGCVLVVNLLLLSKIGKEFSLCNFFHFNDLCMEF